MRFSTFLIVLSFSLPAVSQDPGMMAAQQAQMANDQAQMANQQAIQANQQAMQNAQLANQQAMAAASDIPYGPTLLPRPKFSLKPGTYDTPQQLRLRESGRGATIYYTTDGWTPTTASRQYDGPITLSTTSHLQAIAVSPYGRSFVADAVFTLNTPAASPAKVFATSDGVLPQGTELTLSFAASVDSQTAQVGDKVPLQLVAPIVLDGQPLSPQQVTAQGTVTHVDRRAHVGQPGVLTVRVDWLRANGVTVPLHAVETLEGVNHVERAGYLAAIPGVGAVSLLQHGGEAVIPAGMQIEASVTADTSLKPKS
jgi:hypothetical protein